ncbi:bifunctional glutamate N-acetyltransferase/amino-acid acetyltransferase ArgJ [Peptoniphilus lacrimalis]|uniref:bifunctional glutamate N-acetyltransferase/amino-acid acetyltransferase ArgJ n=1 Tax=Peptoniphilus lacrimalis TaxID=33031 RepID=UPI00254FFD0D|nr:bifunctional glutamate N-acetyltransferase/amino-acid acetyltransferase ArgJ [Peptoniphilus lacrimalis]MDK7722617.1 bifunctional glutamate N-acetyltransferase/amino-acid acetyltransferase ArgJ [Peptoniphilus lacrimalis]MDK7732397.1 bifunctional glutamate N-acetyltransferase/amino-acid acetyltransferase ArgJ [Peptoniphilus lacrimalis]
MDYKKIEGGGITSPKGFLAGATYCGFKSKNSEKPDLAVIYSEKEATCAAVFTTNIFCAAPVILDREILKKGKARAVVINSGIANAATGQKGIDNAKAVEKKAEELLGLGEDQVFVSSTGVIGQQLPVEKALKGLEKIVPTLSREQGTDAAYAIMTTDTVKKESAMEVEFSGGKVTIGAMAKGSGMIHPNMATMLVYITTDAKIEQAELQKYLSASVDDTFNMLSVDGDTSTNDSLFLIANGASGVEIKTEEDKEKFAKLIKEICLDITLRIARDGEGATHMIVSHANNLPTDKDARLVAKSIVCSSLVKTAIYGKDANWGRIMAAAGYSGAKFDVSKADCFLESEAGKIAVMEGGFGTDFDEDKAKEILSEEEIYITVDLHDGDACATAYGCDLTYDYVKINGDYRS